MTTETSSEHEQRNKSFNNNAVVHHTLNVEVVEVKLNQEDGNWDEELEKEQQEWDALEAVQRTESGGIKISAFIPFSEALHHFQSQGIDKDNITPTKSRSGISAFLHLLFGPPKMHPSLLEERDLVFTIAQKQLEDNDIHQRVLQTIYKKLTGARMDCPRVGSHWDTIGFQGNDPASDLRGAGFLSLLHLLHGVTDHNVSGIFSDIYKLSLHEQQHFPFCIMSINITRITISVLRDETLNRECNSRKQVIAVVNDFYIALFWHIYNIWKTQHKTMLHSGHVLKSAEFEASKNPRKMLRTFENMLKERRNKSRNAAVPHSVNVKRSISAASSINHPESIASKNSPRPADSSNSSDTKKNEQSFTDIMEAGDMCDS